jgi:DNA-binding beta-propeller fold protein YncE
MFSRLCSTCVLLGAVSLAPSGAALAEDGGAVKLLTTVPVPGLTVFDISWIDPDTQLYYLADRSNKTVDVIDAKRNVLVKKISGNFKGFTGNNDTSGPDGVVTSGPWLFVTDAPSRVVTINLRTNTVVSEVFTKDDRTDGLRADELALDPEGGVILAVNNADDPPFATLIKVDMTTGKLTRGERITFRGFGPGGDTATGGAEQPVWDRVSGMFYISIPELNGVSADGAVAVINPKTAKVDRTIPVSQCGPAGLTLGPNRDLLIGCGVVFDTAGVACTPAAAPSPAHPIGTPFNCHGNSANPKQVILGAISGSIDRDVFGVGGSDEVWFNSGDGRYYTASRNNPTGPVLGIIDAKRGVLDQIVPTFNTPLNAPAPRGTGHSVAVNPHNNHAFVPLPGGNAFPNCLTGCVAVFETSGGEDRDNR